MARNKKTPDMPTTTTEPDQAEPLPDVVIDYRGTVGASDGQSSVAHVRSPWVLMWPEQGVPRMPLHPGVNIIKGDTWATYSANLKEVKTAVDSHRIRRLRELPDEYALTNEENGLIARTVTAAGLDWIHTQEKSGENRPAVLNAVVARAGIARPMAIEPKVYAEFGGGMDAELTRRGGGQVASPTAHM